MMSIAFRLTQLSEGRSCLPTSLGLASTVWKLSASMALHEVWGRGSGRDAMYKVRQASCLSGGDIKLCVGIIWHYLAGTRS